MPLRHCGGQAGVRDEVGVAAGNAVHGKGDIDGMGQPIVGDSPCEVLHGSMIGPCMDRADDDLDVLGRLTLPGGAEDGDVMSAPRRFLSEAQGIVLESPAREVSVQCQQQVHACFSPFTKSG